jgi:hypothetical protein
MKTKKSWIEKIQKPMECVVKQIDSGFADIPAGSRMLIPTPLIIEDYLRNIGSGMIIDSKILRKDLALAHNADYTCPLTAGIFLRIVAEANFEKLQKGLPLSEIAPFWRAIPLKSSIAKKLSFGTDFIASQQKSESYVERLFPFQII